MGKQSPVTKSQVRSANRRLWLVLLLVVVAIGVGREWDRAYHATHAFDTFLSPPHLFIYAVFLLAIVTAGSIVFARRLRETFGTGFRFPLITFEIPAALAILSGGLLTVALAGLLDDVWHSTFGLDETLWSTPHSMLGWGLFVTFLGFLSCWLALRQTNTNSSLTSVVLGILVLSFSVTPLLGPFFHNQTPDLVRAFASIPVLKAEPAAQHTFRIYLEWNLTRTNPLTVPLSALWAGLTLTLIRGIGKRDTVLLTSTGLSSFLSLLGDRSSAVFLERLLQVTANPASWLPLPIFPAAVLLVALTKIGVSERWTWPIVGAFFGLMVSAIWVRTPIWPIIVVFAAVTAVLGRLIGQRTLQIIKEPAKRRGLLLVAIGIVIPFMTGVVDLALRRLTP